MAFAQNSDLDQYVPTIFEHGVNDFTQELVEAENDIVRSIRKDWFNKKYSPSTFDKRKLDSTQWKKATIYRALAFYILPRLAPFRPEGDAFVQQMKFYKEKFEEEYNAELTVGIRYDEDSDGTIDETEVYEYDRGRLWR